MYNLSNKMNSFLNEEIVLNSKEQKKLRNYKKINIKRIKEGLKEYNKQHNTNYKIVDDRIQGSVSMHTIIKKDAKNYDIGVAIVFDYENIEGLNAKQVRDIVTESLSYQTKQFNSEPICKTSCVRLQYEEGYHVDFAIFRRTKKSYFYDYSYEHAGNGWSTRDIKAVEEWFNNKNDETNGKLRQVVRLCKQYCSLYDNMPGGLVLSALCSDSFYYSENLDECFYRTLRGISSRLIYDNNVVLPFDNWRKITNRVIDKERLSALKKRIDCSMEKIKVVENDDCTREQAEEAWRLFFDNDYFGLNSISRYKIKDVYPVGFVDTEQFIDNKYRIAEMFDIDDNIYTTIIIKGFTPKTLEEYLEEYSHITHGVTIKCEFKNMKKIDYDKILWKVKNEGPEAIRRNDVRGQIIERKTVITENAVFKGQHYIECYLIKNKTCIAVGRVEIPIGDI